MRTVLTGVLSALLSSVIAVSAIVSQAFTPQAFTPQAFANPFGIPGYVPAQTREDSAALAALAPPSNHATARVTYGDAVFARRPQAAADSARRLVREQDGLVRTRCPTRQPRATIRECARAASAFFRRHHIYTPSYVSAPQVFDQPPNRPAPIISPITAFFLDPLR